MTTLLEAKDITKTFGHGKNAVEAVKNVSFSLEENEVVTIVGESGSGKSTDGPDGAGPATDHVGHHDLPGQ